MKTTWALVGAAVLLATPAAAQAADPAKSAKTDARLSLTPDQLKAQNVAQRAEYDRRLEVQKQSTPSLEYLHLNDVPARPTRELEVRVEKYIDGAIMYSTPVDKDQEEVMRSLGQYRDVSSKEQVSDRTIFEGRVYHVMRASNAVNWANVAGKSGVLTMALHNVGGVAVEFKVKK